ncbi:hypothetical protein Bca101_088275 [Brassica carinata]
MKRLLQLPASRFLPPGSGFLPPGSGSLPLGLGAASSFRLPGRGESHNLHISEGSTPKPSGSRRINSRTSGPQEEISVIAGFQEYTSKITKGKDLRPAKRTINFRTTRPTKFLLPRSCPLDLQGITNGSTEATGAISSTAHIQSTSRVNRPKPATSLRISIRPLSISGKSTLLQVQTRPRPKKNPEKEISERRPFHAKPKGPATEKLMLMPTEASNVFPSGLGQTRENDFRPQAP